MTQTTTITPEVAPARESDSPPARLYGLMAEFDTPAAIYEAAKKVRDAGYRWWDCHTPFPVHGLDKAMGIRPTILPWIVFGAGLTGAVLGFILQFYTNVWSFDFWFIVWVRGYPFPISGKPLDLGNLPSYIPVIFELTILLAGTGCVAAMLALNNLPQFYHPLFTNERFGRVTDDKFFLVIEAKDPRFARNKTEAFMRTLNPSRLEAVET